MSYSIDANILLYASNKASPFHDRANEFLASRADDSDLLCLTWPTLMAYLRISTHPTIFSAPLTPTKAWENIENLLNLPRCRVIIEEESFPSDYADVTQGIVVRGNLVPDAHIATILRQHGVNRLYTADTDFLKFRFLEVINPLE
jgi:uncharacterized protein